MARPRVALRTTSPATRPTSSSPRASTSRQLVEQDVTQPVDLLLDERGVDFGDRYSRDAVDAFAIDNQLQCMAYSISPMVIYYNTDIVDFDKMERRGLDVPTADPTAVVGLRRVRRRGPVRLPPGPAPGLYSTRPCRDLAPFIYSGGGQLFDDDTDPTSLAFTDGSTREALSSWLELLRDPQLTLTPEQLEQAPPLTWFKRGELAMIAGFRNLVPRAARRRTASTST